MQVGQCETEALSQMYCLLAVTLMRQNARAILLRCARVPLHEYIKHNCVIIIYFLFILFLVCQYSVHCLFCYNETFCMISIIFNLHIALCKNVLALLSITASASGHLD